MIMFLLKSCFLLIFTFVQCLFASTCENFEVKIKQTLLNQGYHRNLTYGIVFDTEDADCWWLTGCMIGVDQTLPAGVYVNSDELSDLRRIDRLNAIPKNKVNIELPAEQSFPSNVYIIDKVTDNKVSLWLPVHARYHQAASGGGTRRVEIGPPKLYIRCLDKQFDTDRPSTPAQFLCNGSSKEKCSWKEINFTMLTDTLVWHVPIGNLNHYYQVSIITGAVVVIASLYLIKALHEHKSYMDSIISGAKAT